MSVMLSSHRVRFCLLFCLVGCFGPRGPWSRSWAIVAGCVSKNQHGVSLSGVLGREISRIFLRLERCGITRASRLWPPSGPFTCYRASRLEIDGQKLGENGLMDDDSVSFNAASLE